MKTKYNWYAAKTGNLHGQGLVIEELTGKNIAVAYDGADTPLLAAAPAMLKELQVCADMLREAGKDFALANPLAARPNLYELHEAQARAVIQAATGNNSGNWEGKSWKHY